MTEELDNTKYLDLYGDVNNSWVDEKDPNKKTFFYELKEKNYNKLFDLIKRNNTNFNFLNKIYSKTIETLSQPSSIPDSYSDIVNQFYYSKSKDDLMIKIFKNYTENKISSPLNFYIDYDVDKVTNLIFNVTSGKFTLPVKEFYSIPEKVDLYKKLINDLSKIFNLNFDVDKIIEIEKSLSQFIYDEDVQNDLKLWNNNTTFELLDKEYPELNIKNVFKNYLDKRIKVKNPQYLHVYHNIIKKLDLQTLNQYFAFNFITQTSVFVNKELNDLLFDFYNKLLNRKKDNNLDTMFLNLCINNFPNILNSLYYKKFSNKNKENDVINFFDRMKLYIQYKLEKNTWWSKKAKKVAIEKVKDMKLNIFKLNSFFENNTYNLSDDYVTNIFNLLNYEYLASANFLYIESDNYMNSIPSYDVNIHYSLFGNFMNIPIGILQEPFLTDNKIFNSAGLGSIICHEIVHSFDILGKNYDNKNRSKIWWTEDDIENYVNKTENIISLFGLPKNKKTHFFLKELVADIDGLNIILDYIKDENIVTDIIKDYEQFFRYYCYLWRFNKKYEENTFYNKINIILNNNTKFNYLYQMKNEGISIYV
jgi:putative endopeptidase